VAIRSMGGFILYVVIRVIRWVYMWLLGLLGGFICCY
jgi:hypothetical protein